MSRTLLLVDDDPDLRELGEACLRASGRWRVLVAASGAEALGLAARTRPDLVLLDVEMPGLDGPETLARLRADPALAAVPVAFVTANARPHEVERYLALGAAGVIPKPYDPRTFAEQVRVLVAEAP